MGKQIFPTLRADEQAAAAAAASKEERTSLIVENTLKEQATPATSSMNEEVSMEGGGDGQQGPWDLSEHSTDDLFLSQGRGGVSGYSVSEAVPGVKYGGVDAEDEEDGRKRHDLSLVRSLLHFKRRS